MYCVLLYANSMFFASLCSAGRWHGQALSDSPIGRRWLLYCTPHDIQVTCTGSVAMPSWNSSWLKRLSTDFRTLQELVEHYSKDSDGLCVNLRLACVQVGHEMIRGSRLSRVVCGYMVGSNKLSEYFADRKTGHWRAVTPNTRSMGNRS